MRKWLVIFITLFTVGCSLTVLAEENNNQPLLITVSVSDRSDSALNEALQAAFSQAISDMSNDLQIMSLPKMKKAESHVTQWIQSYSYVDANNADAQDNSSQQHLSLQVVFDRNALQQLLKQAKALSIGPVANALSVVTMYVEGVKDINDYSSILRFLRSLPDVKAVTVQNMDTSSVLFDVKITDNLPGFQQALSADTRFSPANEHPSSADLNYSWKMPSASQA